LLRVIAIIIRPSTLDRSDTDCNAAQLFPAFTL